ncbi:hypothetical protein KO481_28045 [Nocardia sp. NEAU-G5]|uniref:Uncharacterized protein n=1 Tax=Nocardia albiluteola TaxID=2842303 RepID=A0ABS6B4Z0_9NOCA|nr:hypothetical protein [Nocardia albiluteola]MBU3065367.1 hypothetical protein [Nocardia albiluteola]
MISRVTALRGGLALLAAFQIELGVWSEFFPRNFFDDFPLPGHSWVSMMPPYNEHLIRDYGGLNLGFAALYVACALSMHPALLRPVLIGFEFFTVPHFIFHAIHLNGFPMLDAVAQTVSLAIVALLPLALLPLVGGEPRYGAICPAGAVATVRESD